MPGITHLIPKFDRLISYVMDEKHDLPTSAMAMLAPFSKTLHTIFQDQTGLLRAVLAVLTSHNSLLSEYDATEDYDKYARECALLASENWDIILLARTLNRLYAGPVEGTIESLPTELIAYIFALSTSRRGWRGAVLSEPFRMKLRAVCRFWRDVIDSTPALWARIDLNNALHDLDPLRSVLHRSKHVPLRLNIHTDSVDSQLLSLISPEMDRVRKLDITGQDPDLGDDSNNTNEEENARHAMYARRLLERPAPLLEKLEVYYLSEIPDSIFAHTTPTRLRKIELEGCLSVPPTACIFQSTALTSLKLKDTHVWGSIDEAIVFLRSVPKLQCFQFDTPLFNDTLPFHSPQNFGSESVHLSQLENLELVMPVDNVALIISILDFPPSTELVIRGSLREETLSPSPEFTSLLDTVQSAFRPHFQKVFPNSTSGYTTIRIGCHERFESEDGFSVTMGEPVQSSTSTVPGFEFGVILDSECQEEYIEVMMQMLSWPGMAYNVTKLSVHHAQFVRRASQWRRLLSTLLALQSARAGGSNAPALFRALQTDTSSPFSSSASPVKTIHVADAKAKAITRIITSLDKRVDAGLPTLDLKLSNCDVEMPVVEQLRQHNGLREVVWDGRTAEWLRKEYWEGGEEGEAVM